MFRDTCRYVRDKLPLHVGRDLDPKQERIVDAHLASCLSCFREYRALGESRALLGVAAEERLPAGILDGFTEEVMARIAVGEEGPAAELPRGARAPLQVLPRLMAAAAMLLVAASAWVYFADGGLAVGRPDTGDLLRSVAPETSAGSGPAMNNARPGGALHTPGGGMRFLVPPTVTVLPSVDDEPTELPSEAERQLDEKLEQVGHPYRIRIPGGGLILERDRDPRERDG